MKSAMPLVLVAVIAGLPVLQALFFRVSAVFVFLSIAVGNLLVLYLGSDAGLASGIVTKGSNGPLVAQLVLLFLPLILSLVFLRKTLPTARIPVHLIPLIACGIMLMTLTIPILPSAAQAQIFESQVGPYFKNSQGLIVGAAAVLTLLLTWFTHKHSEHHGKKHH